VAGEPAAGDAPKVRPCSQTLFADDAPIPALNPGRGRTKTGRLWVYARDQHGVDPRRIAELYAIDTTIPSPIERD
jgi:hypothetical protein